MKKFILIAAVIVSMFAVIAAGYAGTGACETQGCSCKEWKGSPKTLSNDCTSCGHSYNKHK